MKTFGRIFYETDWAKVPHVTVRWCINKTIYRYKT